MKLQNVSRQLTAACRYSYNRLALNYDMYYEICGRENGPGEPPVRDLGSRFHPLLEGLLRGEQPLEELYGLRQAVIERMEQATAYTDCFQAYEYVLNRLEGRLIPAGDTDGDRETDEERLAWIMRYITETGESAVINERIQMVVSQLPVRLTKQKFFALVGEGMAVYAGSPRKNVEDMLYILRSEALLNQPAGMTLAFPQLAGMLAPFERADYRQMTEDEYCLLSERMKEAGEILADYTGELMLLMDLINDLCVVFLSRTGAVMDVAEEERLQAVLRAVREAFSSGAELDTELLRQLEGRQEVCCDQWERYSSPMDILEQEAERDPQAETLRRISLLLSGSSFVPLEPRKTGEEPVDRAELDRLVGELTGRMAEGFAGRSRLVVRALMAKVLSSLPVFFGSLDEVRDYVGGCLDSCADEAEKAVCMRLLRELAG